jgi:hypothetical protein
MPKIVFNKQNWDALAHALSGGHQQIIPQATAHPSGGGGEGATPRHAGGGGGGRGQTPGQAERESIQNKMLREKEFQQWIAGIPGKYGITPEMQAAQRHQEATQQAHQYAIQKMQEQQKLLEDTFEKRFTFKQKAQISQLRQSQNELKNNPNFSDEEKAAINRDIELKISGVTPSDLVKLQPYTKGKEIGSVWDEGGYKLSRDANGKVFKVDKNQKSPADYQAELEHDHAKKTLDWREKATTEDLNKGRKSADGSSLEPKYRTIDEVNKMMDTVHGLRRMPPEISTEQLQQMQLNKHQDILNDAIKNPDKLNNPDFAKQAMEARQGLRQIQQQPIQDQQQQQPQIQQPQLQPQLQQQQPQQQQLEQEQQQSQDEQDQQEE